MKPQTNRFLCFLNARGITQEFFNLTLNDDNNVFNPRMKTDKTKVVSKLDELEAEDFLVALFMWEEDYSDWNRINECWLGICKEGFNPMHDQLV